MLQLLQRLACAAAALSLVQSATAQQLPPESFGTLMVSVADNAPGSALDARRIMEEVRQRPDGSPILELLGHPVGADATFPPLPNSRHFGLEDLTEEYRRTLLNMQHYIALYYGPGTELAEIESRLRGDDRFAFASIDRGGGFSRNPNDPHFTPGGFGPPPPMPTNGTCAPRNLTFHPRGAEIPDGRMWG